MTSDKLTGNKQKCLMTRISGPYRPFILAPAEGWWVGLWPITCAFGPVTIQSMDDLGRLQGRYPENFVLTSLLEFYQEGGGVKKGVLGGRWGILTKDMEDRVVPNIMNHVLLPQGSYPENFVLISLLEVCQECGVKKGVLGGRWGMMTGYLGDMVILDIVDDLLLPKENILKISYWYL